MLDLSSFALVLAAGVFSALATGLGAVPFFFKDDFSSKSRVVLWGLASGIMVSASGFGLVLEGLKKGSGTEVGLGIATGVVLVAVSSKLIDYFDFDHDPDQYVEADFKKMVLILGVLTVHSFPEGVAIGVSFAGLSGSSGLGVFGFTIPILGVFMTLAISVQNVPEGIATSIPLQNLGVSNEKLVGAAVFSSLPQPIGALIAYVFVALADQFLPYGFGFAAGAMTYLVVTEFVPEALDEGSDLRFSGWAAYGAGFVIGAVFMTPLLFI